MKTNHIAFLVGSIKEASKQFPESCKKHEVEEQPSEGTLEQYITFGDDKWASVLLMQAFKDGPYMRAMKKRGPGIHHIGCVCKSIEEEVFQKNASNLFLHSISLKTFESGTIWLCKPGLPFLIELFQDPKSTLLLQESAVLILPEKILVPEYARCFIKNLEIESTRIDIFKIRINGIEVEFDPKKT